MRTLGVFILVVNQVYKRPNDDLWYGEKKTQTFLIQKLWEFRGGVRGRENGNRSWNNVALPAMLRFCLSVFRALREFDIV